MTRGVRPSTTMPPPAHQETPRSVAEALARKRAAKLADMAAIHARVARNEPVFPKGD